MKQSNSIGIPWERVSSQISILRDSPFLILAVFGCCWKRPDKNRPYIYGLMILNRRMLNSNRKGLNSVTLHISFIVMTPDSSGRPAKKNGWHSFRILPAILSRLQRGSDCHIPDHKDIPLFL